MKSRNKLSIHKSTPNIYVHHYDPAENSENIINGYYSDEVQYLHEIRISYISSIYDYITENYIECANFEYQTWRTSIIESFKYYRENYKNKNKYMYTARRFKYISINHNEKVSNHKF